MIRAQNSLLKLVSYMFVELELELIHSLTQFMNQPDTSLNVCQNLTVLIYYGNLIITIYSRA